MSVSFEWCYNRALIDSHELLENFLFHLNNRIFFKLCLEEQTDWNRS